MEKAEMKRKKFKEVYPSPPPPLCHLNSRRGCWRRQDRNNFFNNKKHFQHPNSKSLPLLLLLKRSPIPKR
jgi:hypothetical protein